MVSFQSSALIHAPVEKVFALIADPLRIPEWRVDVPAITRVSGPTAVGTTFMEEVHFMGTHQLLMEVIEHDPQRKLVIEAQRGMSLLPTQAFTFTPVEGGTRVDLEVRMRTSGIFRLMGFMLPAKLKKIWAGYFQKLDQLVQR
jgi:uncharacterized protein YndB with AHSA1/START domain